MRFTQVKLATSEPERLSRFYEDALGCRVSRPLTQLSDPAWRAIGSVEGEVGILVLEMPGDEGGPTLELISAPGLAGGGGFLTFYVDDVDATAGRVVDSGGAFRGEISELAGPSGGTFRFVFMTDPEGNVIDLFAKVS